MGNANSSHFQESHIRIYKKLLALRSPMSRVQVIQTLLAGAEYVEAAKRAGVYSHFLTYIARAKNGEMPGPLPWEAAIAYESGVQQPKSLLVPPAAAAAITQYVEPRHIHQIVLRGEQQGEKAHNYFQSCLLVLGLEEEVALTEEALRIAYKRAAVRSHPDKGGSEEAFEAVSRAYAYLGDILLRIQGGRKKAGKVSAPAVLNETRIEDSRDWQHVEPVKLNPKNLDLNVFNQMFEQNRIPDPEAEGYGDWLKAADKKSGPAFGGKFNRDVFNSTFEEDARSRAGGAGGGALQVLTPDALIMAPGMGTQLGRTYTGDYTAAANATMKYTDLKKAYTTDNVFSHQVAGVRPEPRNLEQYSAARARAPDPITDREMEAIAEAERHTARTEQQRQLRAAQEGQRETQHFERMKRMILMDTKP